MTIRERGRALILLVDDEPSILFTLSLLLEEEGWQVMTAGHGREALDRLYQQRPDLIITDYMMPYVTGVELIAAIRAEPLWVDIPVLLMSAALPAGIDPTQLADAFLAKPASLEQLFAEISRLLGE